MLTLILTLLILSNVMAATNSSDDNQPLLKITEVSQAIFDENEEATLEVTVENIGYTTAYDLNVALNITDNNSYTLSETLSLSLLEALSEPDFEVILATGESILEDDQSTIKFVLSNKGNGAEDVTVAFADNADVGVYMIGADDRYLADFASGKNVTFSMELLTDEGVSGVITNDGEGTIEDISVGIGDRSRDRSTGGMGIT